MLMPNSPLGFMSKQDESILDLNNNWSRRCLSVDFLDFVASSGYLGLMVSCVFFLLLLGTKWDLLYLFGIKVAIKTFSMRLICLSIWFPVWLSQTVCKPIENIQQEGGSSDFLEFYYVSAKSIAVCWTNG